MEAAFFRCAICAMDVADAGGYFLAKDQKDQPVCTPCACVDGKMREGIKRLVGVIDLTPRMLKSAEGRKLVSEANERLLNAITFVACMTANEIDEMEGTDRELREEAFTRVRHAIREWRDAASDFAFTLGGINPETRERYNFSVEE